MKKILTIFSVSFLGIFSVFNFTSAAVSYNRNPSGASITFPVSFSVSFDDFSELGCTGTNFNYWAIELSNSETIISELVPSVIKLHTFVFDQLPAGDFSMVSADCFETLEGDNTNGIFFEGNGVDTLIFTSGGSPPEPPVEIPEEIPVLEPEPKPIIAPIAVGNGPIVGSMGAFVPGGFIGGFVLGASTSTETEQISEQACSVLLTKPLGMGKKNDPEEVKKLQTFLNDYESESLVVDGVFGNLTFKAVKRFQLKYKEQVLAPWLSFGLESIEKPTGFVGKTTTRWINMMICPKLELPIPQLL